MIVMLVVLVMIIAAVYMVGKKYYETHFFRGTTLNGISVGDMTAVDAGYALQNQLRNYTLTLEERNGISETITGDQIYMQYVDNGEVEKILSGQNTILWPIYLAGKKAAYTVNAGFTYDQSSIDSVMDSLDCFSEDNMTAPQDAHIEDNGTEYVVVESSAGNLLKREETKAAIMQAIESGQTKINFEELNLYENPDVNAEDAGLQEKADELNKMLETDITFDFVDRQYTVNREVVRGFIVPDADGNAALSADKVREWVNKMAADTDTFGLEHKFTTTTGETITLAAGGDYGWATNVDATTEQLVAAIQSASTEPMEPVYTYTAMDRSSNDIGDTYVEVCIERQEMWCYKDGTLIVDTPVVTGNHAAGTDTPSGSVWAVDAKMADTRFMASGGVHVDYWLPFNGECGIHDSSWRSQYGGEIWKTSGSHGCVNTPNEAAGKIFDVIGIGYPVIVYYSANEVVGPQPTGEIKAG